MMKCISMTSRGIKIKSVTKVIEPPKDQSLLAKIRQELLERTNSNTLQEKLFNSGDFDASTFLKS